VIDDKQNFLTITAVSRATGYCINTLRDLADRGIVNPQRTDNGVRLFTREDVGRLQARREQMAKREQTAKRA
jgi:DNA-binding transcriptional MerR regulator